MPNVACLSNSELRSYFQHSALSSQNFLRPWPPSLVATSQLSTNDSGACRHRRSEPVGLAATLSVVTAKKLKRSRSGAEQGGAQAEGCPPGWRLTGRGAPREL